MGIWHAGYGILAMRWVTGFGDVSGGLWYAVPVHRRVLAGVRATSSERAIQLSE